MLLPAPFGLQLPNGGLLPLRDEIPVNAVLCGKLRVRTLLHDAAAA